MAEASYTAEDGPSGGFSWEEGLREIDAFFVSPELTAVKRIVTAEPNADKSTLIPSTSSENADQATQQQNEEDESLTVVEDSNQLASMAHLAPGSNHAALSHLTASKDRNTTSPRPTPTRPRSQRHSSLPIRTPQRGSAPTASSEGKNSLIDEMLEEEDARFPRKGTILRDRTSSTRRKERTTHQLQATVDAENDSDADTDAPTSPLSPRSKLTYAAKTSNALSHAGIGPPSKPLQEFEDLRTDAPEEGEAEEGTEEAEEEQDEYHEDEASPPSSPPVPTHNTNTKKRPPKSPATTRPTKKRKTTKRGPKDAHADTGPGAHNEASASRQRHGKAPVGFKELKGLLSRGQVLPSAFKPRMTRAQAGEGAAQAPNAGRAARGRHSSGRGRVDREKIVV